MPALMDSYKCLDPGCKDMDPMNLAASMYHFGKGKHKKAMKGWLLKTDYNRQLKGLGNINLFTRSFVAKLENEGAHPHPQSLYNLQFGFKVTSQTCSLEFQMWDLICEICYLRVGM